jgi:oxygen-independent coproporphyrinogen-3 oxidase
MIQVVDEELDRTFYHYAQEFLKQSGYLQYEISNFSKPNSECKHNLVYWQYEPYIGLGLGAHSFFGNERYHNPLDLRSYIKNSENLSMLLQEVEKISKVMQYAEYMFLGLRLLKGVSKEAFYDHFGCSLQGIYGEQIKKMIQLKMMKEEQGYVKLTKKGLDISNCVFTEFLPE